MDKNYYSNDGRIYFYVDGDDLFILERTDYEKLSLKTIKKLNISTFLVNAYTTIKDILDELYEQFGKYTNLDDYINMYMNNHIDIDEDNKMLMNSNLTIRKLCLLFNVLVDYSEDNPVLCHPTYTKKYDCKSFDTLKHFTSINYECVFASNGVEIINVITTSDYVNFIAYLCYTADKSVKRFKICPASYRAFIDGTATKYFYSDADKSRYSRMVRQDVVLNEYKNNLNTLFLFLKYKTKNEDKEKMKDAIFEFVQCMRSELATMVRWDKLVKSNKGIYHFSESNLKDESLLGFYKYAAQVNWRQAAIKYDLTDYVIFPNN